MSHTVVIHSFDERPFRVRGVEPANLISSCKFSHEAGSTQTLKIQIDPDRAARDKEAVIMIKTDRRDSPAVLLKIVILPAGV